MSDSEKIYPGDEIVTHPVIELTYAQVINAQPDAIWPWLLQVGYHRGGWYIDKWSDRIEQKYFWPLLVPKEARGTWQPAADEILSEYQNLKVGDTIPDGPPGSAYYKVVQLKRNRVMVLQATTHFKYMAPKFVQGTRFEPKGIWSWTFILEPISRTQSNLISRWRGTGTPTAYMKLLKPLIMLIDHHQQKEILKGIKLRVEKGDNRQHHFVNRDALNHSRSRQPRPVSQQGIRAQTCGMPEDVALNVEII